MPSAVLLAAQRCSRALWPVDGEEQRGTPAVGLEPETLGSDFYLGAGDLGASGLAARSCHRLGSGTLAWNWHSAKWLDCLTITMVRFTSQSLRSYSSERSIGNYGFDSVTFPPPCGGLILSIKSLKCEKWFMESLRKKFRVLHAFCWFLILSIILILFISNTTKHIFKIQTVKSHPWRFSQLFHWFDFYF